MATKKARPGRTLVVFLLGTAILYGLVALAGSWKPQLGLDLQGGTRITLQAKGDPGQDNLEEARSIIDRRVNGSGVAETEVITQGDNIVVEIPGEQRRELVETVQRQAQLRFRLVACRDICDQASQTDLPPEVTIPETTPTVSTGEEEVPPGTETPDGDPSASSPPASPPAGNPRVAPFGRNGEQPTDDPTATGNPGNQGGKKGNRGGQSGTPTDAPSTEAPTGTPTSPATPGATDTPTDAPTEGVTPTTPAETDDFDTNAVVSLDDAIAYKDGGYASATRTIDGAQLSDVQLFDSYECNADGSLTKLETAPAGVPDVPIDDPSLGLVACSPATEKVGDTPAAPATKYLLTPAVIQGTDLADAGYAIPQNEVQYAVTLELEGKGQDVFAEASSTLINPGGNSNDNFFAIVLDGVVLSAPYFSSVISDGNAQISGNFTETEARSLSTSLKYGSLPIAFEEPTVETIGPSLAGDQLTAGLTAGAFGLGLVLIYCLLYYRGLGLVVVASLLAATAVTYALVLLLSETAGFVLTLPGIAGLIIAVGVTADSFIIFFERIRDEMREGKSMRVAVESGWKRAKVTRLAAQVVSLLSAAVLYIFATGAVKGFGFALGLTTLVDLAILFWFTKPMVSWLARFKFFNSGSRLSGLSPETLGIDGPATPEARPRATATAGGKA